MPEKTITDESWDFNDIANGREFTASDMMEFALYLAGLPLSKQNVVEDLIDWKEEHKPVEQPVNKQDEGSSVTLQDLVRDFFNKNPTAGASYAFCEGFKIAQSEIQQLKAELTEAKADLPNLPFMADAEVQKLINENISLKAELTEAKERLLTIRLKKSS